MAIENIFHAVNARSALKLGHARGVAMLAAIEAGVTVVEYTPAEIKRSVVGYGRAEKPQVAQMVKLLLGLDAIPKPHDATDALAVAICHLHNGPAFAKARRQGSARTKSAQSARLATAKTRPDEVAGGSRSGRADDRTPLRHALPTSIRID